MARPCFDEFHDRRNRISKTDRILFSGGLISDSMNALRASGMAYVNKLFSSSSKWLNIEGLLRRGETRFGAVLVQVVIH